MQDSKHTHVQYNFSLETSPISTCLYYGQFIQSLKTSSFLKHSYGVPLYSMHHRCNLNPDRNVSEVKSRFLFWALYGLSKLLGVQPRSQSSSAISDVTSPVKLVGKIRLGLSRSVPSLLWSLGQREQAWVRGWIQTCWGIFFLMTCFPWSAAT